MASKALLVLGVIIVFVAKLTRIITAIAIFGVYGVVSAANAQVQSAPQAAEGRTVANAQSFVEKGQMFIEHIKARYGAQLIETDARRAIKGLAITHPKTCRVKFSWLEAVSYEKDEDMWFQFSYGDISDVKIVPNQDIPSLIDTISLKIEQFGTVRINYSEDDMAARASSAIEFLRDRCPRTVPASPF